jgi:glycosyltransferase involved in cell wall biosynthesis
MGKRQQKLARRLAQATPKTVSILTPSRLLRAPFLKVLCKIISKQDYPHIMEWIIVDCSPTEQQDEFKTIVESLNPGPHIEVKYYDTKNYNGARCVGYVRNLTNQYARGDIMVCMDDDDYYPPGKVSLCVKELSKSKKKICGTDDVILYDAETEKVVHYLNFGTNHGTNNTMAYTKEYSKTHFYDNSATFAEEGGFTNNFTEPMIQIDPMKGQLVISHTTNTYDKKKLMYQCILSGTRKGDAMKFEDFVKDQEIASDMKGLFDKLYPEVYSPYDIVYMCGLMGIQWSPLDKSLGGSEQAVVHLSEEWVRMGLKVCVYGAFAKPYVKDGVQYMPMERFRFSHRYRRVIVWRHIGINLVSYLPIKCDQMFIDLHDNPISMCQPLMTIQPYKAIFLKSQFHFDLMQHGYKTVPVSRQLRCHIVPNGLRVEPFVKQPEGVLRNPYRLCYCSCYTRGLEQILQHFWPTFKKLEPRAELHTYYGMDHVQEDIKQRLIPLLKQDGVFDHGRQPMEEIVKEKYTSSFQLYFTNSLLEIDCISIRESLLTGCIPILSTENLFQYRDGLHFSQPTNDPRSYYNLVEFVREWVNKPEMERENLRQQLRQSQTIMDWKTCAQHWLTLMDEEEVKQQPQPIVTELEIMTGGGDSQSENHNVDQTQQLKMIEIE